MIRVAQVVGKMSGGGVEAVVMNYYRHIDRNRVQFDFIVESDSELIPQEEIESLGGRVFLVPPITDLRSYMHAIEELFQSGEWRIVHSHRNALSVFPLCAAKHAGIPVRIAHSHSTSGKGEYVKNAAKTFLKLFSNVYPTYKFACSHYAGEWLFGKNADFEILYNAIELDKFFFNAEVRSATRTDLGLNDDTLVIGHVGRFMPQKNHAFLIEAFAELVKLRPDSILLCVGSGEDEAAIKRLAVERRVADKIIFLGQRNDVERLYQAFDVFALPSLYEGLCVVGIEAQMAGLPCVLSNTITREVDVTGTIRYLPINDPNIWAIEIANYETGNRQEAVFSDFRTYDIDYQAPKLLEAYEKMLQEEAR